MAKQYKGSLTLDWYNKQKAILLRSNEETKLESDVPAPKISWVNKDEALFYEIDKKEGRGLSPYWVDRNDIRVKEARPLLFQKIYKAVPKSKSGTLPGTSMEYKIEELNEDDPNIENILIKGDNLLALNTLKKIFDNKPEEEKIKCIYVDPPYNTGSAFEHYDDNLAISEWLTMFRDRLVILYSLLKNDGCIFIQLDDECVSQCKLLLDEVFGAKNFITKISVKRSAPTGHKAINPSPITVCDYILVYAKNKEKWNYIIQYTAREFDNAYSKFIEPYSDDFNKWEFITLNEAMSRYKMSIEELLKHYSNRIIRFAQPNYEGVGQDTRDLIDISKTKPNKIFLQKREEFPDIYLLNGNRILFYKDKLKNIDGNITTAEPLTNFWVDIPFQGIAKEGNVVFPQSKKPEKLLKRIYEMCTKENDTVLDCFGGSGTSFAVAHKLKRKWIGVEIGNHCDKLILPRLRSVLKGDDLSGISKLSSVNWLGGGSFKYYHLGNSIIKIDPDGTGDFNWNLGKEFIQESFLSSYDYILDNSIDFKDGELFSNKKNQPIVGIQTVGTKKRVAVVTLNEPNSKFSTLSYEEMQSIYKTVKKKYSPEYINIFTNRGIEIAYDSKPDDLEVIKIPNAIFAELEK